MWASFEGLITLVEAVSKLAAILKALEELEKSRTVLIWGISLLFVFKSENRM